LRHWCASALLAEGVPPSAVAGYLGDTLETTMRVYAHWLRDEFDLPAETLARVLHVDTEAAGTALGRNLLCA
jgi:integrase